MRDKWRSRMFRLRAYKNMTLYARQPCSSISPSSKGFRCAKNTWGSVVLCTRDTRKYGLFALIGPAHPFPLHQKGLYVLFAVYLFLLHHRWDFIGQIYVYVMQSSSVKIYGVLFSPNLRRSYVREMPCLEKISKCKIHHNPLRKSLHRTCYKF